MKPTLRWLCVSICCVFIPLTLTAGRFETGVVKPSDSGDFYLNGIPAIARLASGKFLVVWTAYSKAEDRRRIVASFSSDDGRTWSPPRTLIKTPGMSDWDPNILLDSQRIFLYTTTTAQRSPYTPVKETLFEYTKTFMVKSEDEGATWSEPIEIKMPRKYAGKRDNGLKLMDGTLAMPCYWDLWAERGIPAKTEGEMNLASGILLSHDGIHWTPFGQIHAWIEKSSPYSSGGLAEPALVQLNNGELLMVMRAPTPYHYESRSQDGGLTWDPPHLSTVPGHNTPVVLWRLEQQPEEIIAVFNNSPTYRFPLSVAISANGGRCWSKPRDIAGADRRQAAYPSITQTKDGTFVAVWHQTVESGGQDVRWARFTREWVLSKEW